MTTTTTTHEDFIQRVREIVVAEGLRTGSISAEEAARLVHTKLLYGVGQTGVRGVCYYQVWENGVGKVDVVEVSAMVQESWIQLAGTVIHELAHVLAGVGAGHAVEWKDVAVRLGFTKRPEAAGQRYSLALLKPRVRTAIYRLAAEISDGSPAFATSGDMYATLMKLIAKPRPCSAGIGTRGGKSRGKGSGSRMRLWECECSPKPVKVRVASDEFNATCGICEAKFHRA